MSGTSAVVLPVRQRTPEWLAARLDGIGASEAAAVLGLSEYESPIGLWARKLGLVPPPAETLPMRIGTALEPLIARLYTEATGQKIRRANNLRQHPAHPFMLASLDRRAGRKPIELKYSARGKGYGEAGTDEVPDEVLVQVLHQLAVTDEPEADVAALIAGRYDVQIYTIRRDAEAEAAIIEREAVFWDRVQTRREPPIDGSEATLRALAAVYPRDDGESIDADEPTAAALRELRLAAAMEATAIAGKGEARARIQAFMGTATRLVAPGVGEVTWKATKDSQRTDWQAVAAQMEAENPVVYAALVANHTTTSPGTRRFGPPKFEED